MRTIVSITLLCSSLILSSCSSNAIDTDQAQTLLNQHFPFKVYGVFYSERSSAKNPWNQQLKNKYQKLKQEKLVDFQIIQEKQRVGLLGRTKMVARQEVYIPDGTQYVDHSQTTRDKSFLNGERIKYRVEAGRLTLPSVKHVFQEEDSKVAEIKFTVHFEPNPFNNFVSAYYQLFPFIKLNTQASTSQKLINQYQKRKRPNTPQNNHASPIIVEHTIMAKLYEDGWKLDF